MKRRTFLLDSVAAGLGLALTRASAQEAPTVYDVELVVFQNLNPNATPEDWAFEAGQRQQSAPIAMDGEETSVVAAASDTLAVSGRQILSRDQFRLNAIASALQRNRNYRTLAHVGWSQVGSPLNAAVPERLDALLPSGLVSGSAALARGRYLHLTLDLDFQSEGGQHYVLRQTRRMRSTERHYFDHPQFGVIALVTPQGQAGAR